MKFLRTLFVVALIALGMTFQTVSAQGGSATIQATTTVQAALIVTPRHDLTFGTVTAGTSSSVGTTQPEAGQWNLTGQGNMSVSLTFTLPTQLTGTGTPVPINTFNGLFSPSSTPTGNSVSLSSGQAVNSFLSGGSLWVFIGGTISPPVGSAGSYSAPIVLTVAYL